MIEIYALKKPNFIPNDTYSDLLERLSENKKKKILGRRKRENTYTEILGELIIRYLVCQKYNVNNSDVEFYSNIYKKPLLKNFTNFHFNLSHSEDWVVCITDTSHVGIDVEYVQPIDLDILKTFFSAQEYEDLKQLNLDHRISYFYDLWTLKESYIKALGIGITMSLNTFTIRKYNNLSIDLISDKSYPKYFFRQYYLNENYRLSACATTKNFPKDLIFINYKELINFFKIKE
ncbi:4'-phosphopantetheinyl transferase family protein [Priestia megaterium]